MAKGHKQWRRGSSQDTTQIFRTASLKNKKKLKLVKHIIYQVQIFGIAAATYKNPEVPKTSNSSNKKDATTFAFKINDFKQLNKRPTAL